MQYESNKKKKNQNNGINVPTDLNVGKNQNGWPLAKIENFKNIRRVSTHDTKNVRVIPPVQLQSSQTAVFFWLAIRNNLPNYTSK